MPQENEPHYRQEILVAGIVGIGPQGVGRGPKAFLNGFDVFKLGHVRPFLRGILPCSQFLRAGIGSSA
jgi:hypothetical protein